MKNSVLIIALSVVSLSSVGCRAYSSQPVHKPCESVNSFPHPGYGAPPPILSRTKVPCDPHHTETSTALMQQTAVVRPLEPFGKNYEVKPSQPQPQYLSLEPQLPSQFSGHRQFALVGPAYLPPTQFTPPRPFQQQYSNAGPHTSHHDLQLTPHQSPSKLPLSLVPPPSNHNNQHQQYLPPSIAQTPSNGDYISQSEVGQLDHYFEKQNPVGETRDYVRLITTCYPNGKCKQQHLGAGQVDAKHQHIVQEARAHVQPISDKCRSSSSRSLVVDHNSLADNENKVHSSILKTLEKSSDIRPPNRRLYPYTETVIPRDPFN